MNLLKVIAFLFLAPTFILAELINFFGVKLFGGNSSKVSLAIASLVVTFTIHTWVPPFLPREAPLDSLNMAISIEIKFSIWGLLHAWVNSMGAIIITSALLVLRVTWYILAFPSITYLGAMIFIGWLY